jgi:hypothetical protein
MSLWDPPKQDSELTEEEKNSRDRMNAALAKAGNTLKSMTEVEIIQLKKNVEERNQDRLKAYRTKISMQTWFKRLD